MSLASRVICRSSAASVGSTDFSLVRGVATGAAPALSVTLPTTTAKSSAVSASALQRRGIALAVPITSPPHRHTCVRVRTGTLGAGIVTNRRQLEALYPAC